MKKIHYSLFSLLLILITSFTIKPQKSFEKIVWLELDYKNDSLLFTPYSKAWQERWQLLDSDLNSNGTPIMNIDRYKYSFNNRKDNIYTLIHPKIIDGTFQLYSPYNPELFGFGSNDDGELRFPIKGENDNETFLTSQKLRNEYAYYLGKFGPQESIPLVDEYGEPVTRVDSLTGLTEYVYPPSDFMWYEDIDILKYKLRISISYNKKGIEKKRTIEAIAPVVYEINEGQIEGEKELFWLDFEEASSTLQEGFYFNASGKPVTFLKHIEQRVVNASF